MKFTVSSAELLRALTTVSAAMPSKASYGSLEGVLFQHEGGRLRLTATDLEVSAEQVLAVRFDGIPANSVVIPAKQLISTLRALPDLPVTVATDEQANVTLKTDQGRYKMVGFDGSDFPALEPEGAAGPITRLHAEGSLLRRIVAETSFAMSHDTLRPAMRGIYFKLGVDGGVAVATDGHRMVRLRVEDLALPDGEPVAFILSERAVQIVTKVLPEEPLEIVLTESHVRFEHGTGCLVARLIDEDYPNYEAVIPTENEYLAGVNRQSLLAAVRRVGLYASATTRQVRLTLGFEQIQVSAENIERASEATETVLCDYTGPAMQIGFNGEYLAEGLSNLASEDVVLEVGSPNRACILCPAVQHEGEELTTLLMPVLLNTYA